MLIAKNNRVDGYAVITGPEGVDEFNTLRCNHCQRIIIKGFEINGKEPDWDWCSVCSGYVCGPCNEERMTKGCQNFLRIIEEAEEKEYANRHRGY